MQPRNYATKAVPHITGFAKALAPKAPGSALVAGYVAERLGVAPQFLLPDGGLTFDPDMNRQPFMEMLNLPYSEIVAEFFVPSLSRDLIVKNEYTGQAQMICEKRLAFASKPLLTLILAAMGSMLEDNAAKAFRERWAERIDRGAFAIMAVFENRLPTGPFWTISSHAGVIWPNDNQVFNYERLTPMRAAYLQGANPKLPRYNGLDGEVLPALFEVAYATSKSMESEERALCEAENDLADEMRAVVDLVLSLNCQNSEVEQIPASQKLNARRAKQGKPLLNSYHIVRIAGSAAKRAEANGGSHASPRYHFRRGHIRRRQNGCISWVRPTVVGRLDAGRVDKHYEVAAA